MFSSQQWQEGMLFSPPGLPKSFTGRTEQPGDCLRACMGHGRLSSFLLQLLYVHHVVGQMLNCLFSSPLLHSLSLSYPFHNSSHWGHVLLGKSSFIYATNLVYQTWAVLLSVHCAWVRFITCKTQLSSLLVTRLTFFLWLGKVPKWSLWLSGMILRSKLKFWPVLYGEGLTASGFLGVIQKQCCGSEMTLFSAGAGINMIRNWAISLFLVHI